MRSQAKAEKSSVVYHKTKNPFGTRICGDIRFQMLLYILKVKYQVDQQFCSLSFSDVMSKLEIV